MRRASHIALGLAIACASVGSARANIQVPWLGGGGQTPTITGTPTVGQTLTVPAYAGAAYKWLRNGTAITGATSSTYTLVTADGGTTVSVAITLAGVSVTAGGVTVGQYDFSQAANSGLLTTLP